MSDRICGRGTTRAKGICGVIEPAARLRPQVDPAGVRCRRAPHGVLLYHIATDAVYETNQTGWEILRQLDGRRTAREVAAALARRYAQPPGAMRAAVSRFIQALDRRGFVAWV